MRRSAVTGIGVVAPGGTGARGVLGDDHRRPDRHPRDHLLRPVGLPLPDRRRVRLRPARRRADRARGAPHGPLHPVRGRRRRWRRSPTAASTSRPSTASAWASRLGTRRRRHHGASRTSTSRSQQPRPGVAGRPRLRDARSSTTALVPSSLAERGRGQVRRPRALPLVISTGCTSGIDAIGYGAPADPGRRGRHRDRRRRRSRRSRRSRWPASTRSRRPRAATTTRSTPRGRSTATATGSSWARAARSWCSRSWSRRRPRRAHLLRGRGLRRAAATRTT